MLAFTFDKDFYTFTALKAGTGFVDFDSGTANTHVILNNIAYRSK